MRDLIMFNSIAPIYYILCIVLLFHMRAVYFFVQCQVYLNPSYNLDGLFPLLISLLLNNILWVQI